MDVDHEADAMGGDKLGQRRFVGRFAVVVGIALGASKGVERVSAGALGQQADKSRGVLIFLLVAAVAPVGRAVGSGEQHRQYAPFVAERRLAVAGRFPIRYVRLQGDEPIENCGNIHIAILGNPAGNCQMSDG